MSSIADRIREFLTRRASELRQTVRVTIGVGAAYAAYKALGLPQGYWAVFTVIIVMQGSIGGTLGAATERMIGTLAGAIFGGLAAAFHSNTSLGIGIALVLVTCVTVWGAAVRPPIAGGAGHRRHHAADRTGRCAGRTIRSRPHH